MIPIAWNVEKCNFEKIEKIFTFRKIWDLNFFSKSWKFWKKLKFSNFPYLRFNVAELIFEMYCRIGLASKLEISL